MGAAMRVCVMIQLGGTLSIDRIREDVPRLLEIAKSASKGEFEQVDLPVRFFSNSD